MIGMALVAVLMCVNFAACNGSDDDEEIANINFEGKWYVSHEKWYDCELAVPNMNDYSERFYNFHEGDVWIFTRKSDGSYMLNRGGSEYVLELVRKNTFRKGDDLFTIIKLTETEMVLEFWDNYLEWYDISGKQIKFEEDYTGELGFGYYTLVR